MAEPGIRETLCDKVVRCGHIRAPGLYQIMVSAFKPNFKLGSAKWDEDKHTLSVLIVKEGK